MTSRKHYLDWLRVIAFGLLIVFHAGLLYVTWPYNLKSPRILPELEWLLSALTPWRMAMVFVISGVACRFLLEKLGPGRFAWDRLVRLQPAILFGMFVVIPPQTWIELVAKGVTHLSYLQFWLGEYLPAHQAMVRPLGKTMPTWDHLWFLVYLFAYAMALAGTARVFGFGRGGQPARLPRALILVGPAVWLAAAYVCVDLFAPPTWNWNDWGAHFKWTGMFAAGFLMGQRDDIWTFVRERRATLAAAAAALLALNLACRAWWLGQPAHGLAAVAYWTSAGFYGWCMVLTVFGYAARYLDRPSKALSYLNEAVLPVYVLHQPILLLAAYALFPLRLPLPLEAAILIGGTGLGALTIFHLVIRPFDEIRFLFGVKPKARGAPLWRPSLRVPADDLA